VEEIQIENFEDSNRCLASLLWPRIGHLDLLVKSIWCSWTVYNCDFTKPLVGPRQDYCDHLLYWATGSFVLPWDLQLWI